MKDSVAVTRSWFYRFVRAVAIVEMAYYVAVVIDMLLHPGAPDIGQNPAALRFIYVLVATPIILALGVLVLRRTKGNLIGWLLIAWGAADGTGGVGVYAFGGYAAELNLLSGSLWPVLFAIPLFFPDGEPYPRRLGQIVQGVVVASIVLLVLIPLGSPVMNNTVPLRAGTPNRFYVPFLLPLTTELSFLREVPALTLIALLVLSVPRRFRASHGRERQQLKYMLWTAVVLVVTIVMSVEVGIFDMSASAMSGWRRILAYALALAILLIPVFGVALPILRHRLYDIDIIIRRTVTYTLLTALLLGVYFGGVVILQQVFVTITGQRSELAIILSTLVIAALFVPLRNRVQSVIDQRFYRRKVDAQHVLESFALTARNETDPQKLSMQLVDAIDDTLQPEHVSLWLNEVVLNAEALKEQERS